jgi:hypothetical protein
VHHSFSLSFVSFLEAVERGRKEKSTSHNEKEETASMSLYRETREEGGTARKTSGVQQRGKAGRVWYGGRTRKEEGQVELRRSG